MKDIKVIVCDNLIALRKSKKLTQKDLAKKIGYSDKAISRWENGEVMPDYEVLQSICDVYGVPVSYMFEQHEEIANTKIQTGNKIALAFVYICILWTIISIFYVYFKTVNGVEYWLIFIWGLTASCLIMSYCNSKFLHYKSITIAARSLALWSLITGIYLQTIAFNIWPLFLVGIPAQAAIIIGVFVRK